MLMPLEFPIPSTLQISEAQQTQHKHRTNALSETDFQRHRTYDWNQQCDVL